MLQYPKRTHVTLPSVESWGTNNNIIRDPPKGIFTRRKDKALESSYLAEEIDASGDRINEVINVFPRGRNPMAPVSFSNSNAGLRGGVTSHSNGRQAYPPMRIMRDGAFRPPVLTARELLPLSRQPRAFTSVSSNVEAPNYTVERSCTNPQREITERRKYALGTLPEDKKRGDERNSGDNGMERNIAEKNYYSLNPTLTSYLTEGEIDRNRERFLQDKTYLSVASNPSQPGLVEVEVEYDGRDVRDKNYTSFTTNIAKPGLVQFLDTIKSYNEKCINADRTHFTVVTNLSDIVERRIDNNLQSERYLSDKSYLPYSTNVKGSYESTERSNIDMERYLSDRTYLPYSTNISGLGNTTIESNIQLEKNLPVHSITTNIYDSTVDGTNYHNPDLKLEKNLPTHSYTTNISDLTVSKNPYENTDISLSRKIPEHSISSLPSDSRVYVNVSSTDAFLKDKISAGRTGVFEGKPTMPIEYTEHSSDLRNTKRTNLNRRSYDMFKGRYETSSLPSTAPYVG